MKLIRTMHGVYNSYEGYQYYEIYSVTENPIAKTQYSARFWASKAHGLVSTRPRPSCTGYKRECMGYLFKVIEVYSKREMYKE